MSINNKSVIGIICTLITSYQVIAQEQPQEQLIQQNGYTNIVIDTKHEQKHPLDSITTLSLPNNIRFVGQAMNYVLHPSGYELPNLRNTNRQALKLYSMPVPVVNRDFKRATVKQIIETLAGQGYELLINDQDRTVDIIPLTEKED